MKKILGCAVVVLFFVLSASAQYNPVPNAGFESWSGTPATPDKWTVLNFHIPLLGDFVSASKTGDSHSGIYALLLESMSIVIPPFPPLPPFAGSATSSFAFDQRPTVLKGYYKYIPDSIDTASISVLLTKWNASAGKTDTIAQALKIFAYTVSSYTSFNIQLTYLSAETPDSASIAMLSSPSATPSAGSKLYVDDLAFYPVYTGVSDAQDFPVSTSVFPNPCSSVVSLDLQDIPQARSIVLFDLRGSEWMKIPVSDKRVMLNVSQIPNGLYLCRIFDGNSQFISTKKISVLK